MKKSVWICVFSWTLFLAFGALAKTPDGKPPSVETICDNEHGVLFGLCNAYCEAMDCLDPNQHASDQGCASVLKNWQKHTDRPLPCTLICSCPGLVDLAAKITAGDVTVSQCIMSEGSLFVETSIGDYNINNGEIQLSCGPNGEPSPEPLPTNDSLACRIAVRKAIEARGGVCVFPE